MKFKTVKTILTVAKENQQYGEINLKSGSSVYFCFKGLGESDADNFGYNSDTEVVSVLKNSADVYIDCEAIESIRVEK